MSLSSSSGRLALITAGALTMAGVLAMFAACAEADDGVRSPEPSPPAETGTDGESDDASADDASVSDAAIVAEPSPPLQPCDEATPCPIAVPAPIPVERNLVSISGSARNDVWALGSSSTLLHFDGNEWVAPTTWVGAELGQNTLRGIWVPRADDVWFIDGIDLVHSNGWRGPGATEFERVRTDLPLAADLGGYPGEDAWSISFNKFNLGVSLTRWSPWEDSGTREVESVSVTFLTQMYQYHAISAADANTIWIAGTHGKIYRRWRGDAGARWRGEEWNSNTKAPLADVAARGSEVWAVGTRGVVRRLGSDRNGNMRFSSVDTGSMANIRAIHLFSADDVWIVGERATILHFDGTSWWRVPTPFEGSAEPPTLHAVWGADSGDVWFVGRGTVMRLQRGGAKP